MKSPNFSKMKTGALLFALIVPFMARAQDSTSVTFYGVVDTAIEYVNNIPQYQNGVETGKHSSVHFTNLTSSVPSRWGLRGREDLGNGLSAVFNLESGFNTGTGTSGQGGRLFGRQAWVGLKGDWGQLAFGRQNSMLLYSLVRADIMGPSAHGLAAFDTFIPNARIDNAITYRANFNGFKFGAAYSRGRNSVAGVTPAAANCGVDYGDQSACSSWSAMMGYDTANWGVAAGYDTMRGNTPVVNYEGLAAGEKDTHWTINGYVKFDALKIGLLYMNHKTDAVQGLNKTAPFNSGRSLGDRSDMWQLGASYRVSPAVTLDGTVNYLRYNNATESSNSWYYVARATYSLSKRTAVYVSAAYMKNKGLSANSAASGTALVLAQQGGNQTAVMTGLRHSF